MTTNVASMTTGVNHLGNPAVAGLANDSRVPTWQQLLMGKNPPNHLKAWRQHFNMTQQQVADIVGTDKTQVSRLERGKRAVDLEWIELFAGAFKIKNGDLMAPPPKKLSPTPSKIVQPTNGILTISDDPPPDKEAFLMEKHEIDLILKYRGLNERGRNYIKLVVNDEYSRIKIEEALIHSGVSITEPVK